MTVCPRNREADYQLREFAGMPQMLMSAEDLQTYFLKQELPPHLSDWLVFGDSDLSIVEVRIGLSRTLHAPFRDHLTSALARVAKPSAANQKLFDLAVYYASHVPLDALLPNNGHVRTCSYTYRGTQILFAADGNAQWLIDNVCEDIQFYGPLLDTFTHATPGIDAKFYGGTLGPSDTRSFMPLCHVPSAGMLLHLYLVGLPMASTGSEFAILATSLVTAVHDHLKTLLPSGESYDSITDPERRAMFFDMQQCLYDAVYRHSDKFRNDVLACVHGLLLRPVASVAATHSHAPYHAMPPVSARKLLCMSTMASKQTRSADVDALVKGKKTNERQGLMVPHVIYGF